MIVFKCGCDFGTLEMKMEMTYDVIVQVYEGIWTAFKYLSLPQMRQSLRMGSAWITLHDVIWRLYTLTGG